MILPAWRTGEVAVIGLGRTGRATARWLAAQDVSVYASDASAEPELESAAECLRAEGVVVDVGRHDLGRIARAAGAIVSPGVPPWAPAAAAAREAGVPVWSDVNLASLALPDARVIVVTGTNGKSTTTSLCAQLLRAGGVSAEAAGNIGRPVVELASADAPPAWVVLEASSFQLHDAPDLDPAIGVVTNLSPDHLDRYASVDEYYADKGRLFRNATAQSVWVLNGDDPAVGRLAAGAVGRRRTWRLTGRADAWYDRETGAFVLDGETILRRDRFPLLGDHNVDNALAAALAARAAGASVGVLGAGLAEARGLPHRLEPVREVGGVLWVNDSKATNLGSTRMALRSMTRPYVLILGGRHKGEPYAGLAGEFGDRCRGVVAYGEAAAIIVGDLNGLVRVERADQFTAAIARAASLAQVGDAVLLSPACSSYDQFASYEKRGDAFRAVVDGL